MALKNDLYINVEPYTEILGGLSFILSISNGVVKLSGQTGTGKTALCIELLQELRTEKIEFVHFPDAPEDFAAVEKAIKEKLKLQPKTEGDRESFIQALTAHIIKKSFDEQKLVLIFDDAEKLNPDLISELTTFRHIHLNDQGLVSIVISGTEEMEKKLNENASSMVSDLLVSYTLEPMNREQLAEFCRAYLEEIKMDSSLTEENLEQLLEITQGLPGDIPERIPEILDQDTQKVYTRKKRQKELVTKTTKTLTHEFVDPFTDEETQKQVLKRLRWPVGPSIIIAGIAVGLFLGYAAYVFLPEDIIPPTVSYFGDEIEDAVEAVEDFIADAPEPEVPEPPATEVTEEVSEPEAPVELATEAQQEPVPEPEPAPQVEPEPEVAEAPQEVTGEPAESVQEIPEAEIPPVQEIAQDDEVPEQTAPQVTASDEVEALIQGWLQAWENQDVNGYFDSYHEEYEPENFASLAAWRNQRERNITRPASIMIDYQDYMVLSRNADSTMVTLRMEYQSPTYADRTLKQLGLIRDAQGEWKIIYEGNVQVERIPVNRVAGSSTNRLPVYLIPQYSDSPEVPATPAEPGATVSNLNDDQEQLFDFVNNWLVAWQNQDVNEYFNHYRSNFRGFNFTSPQAWEQDRMVKITRPSYIDLRLSDFEVVMETANDAVVQFSLEYRSPYYADRTRKEILLTRDARGNLQIANELNRQVEVLPIYRRVNNALALF